MVGVRGVQRRTSKLCCGACVSVTKVWHIGTHHFRMDIVNLVAALPLFATRTE